MESTPLENSNQKWEKAMEKRHSNARKTVCFARNSIENAADINEMSDYDDSDGNTDAFSTLYKKNTNQEMYASNSLYRTSCTICKKVKEPFLVCHYKKCHPDEEVPIARPSPIMASKLRLQNQLFVQNADKIEGNCYFCETTKSMSKSSWEKHLLTHTGERKFYCTECETRFEQQQHHDKECPGKPANIFHLNSPTGILAGFLCKDCNYLQIHREQLVNHLKNEHGYVDPREHYHYNQFTLVPSFVAAK